MPPLAALLPAWLALAPAAAAAAADVRDPPATPRTRAASDHYHLANGLEVILRHDPRLPLIAVHLRYHVGAVDDDGNERGRRVLDGDADPGEIVFIEESPLYGLRFYLGVPVERVQSLEGCLGMLCLFLDQRPRRIGVRRGGEAQDCPGHLAEPLGEKQAQRSLEQRQGRQVGQVFQIGRAHV